MKQFFLFGFLFLAAHIHAQDDTRGRTTEPQASGSILVVPFESKMLLSDINRKIGSQYNMTLEEIRVLFRAEANAAIKKAACGHLRLTFLSPTDTENAKEMGGFFGAAAYKQEVMQGREASVPEYEKTVLTEGEIKSVVEYGHKYMALAPSDSVKWQTLTTKYTCDRILVITQMDIKNTTRPESSDPATGYLLRWHFELFDSGQNRLAGGAVSRWMPLDPKVDLMDNLKARMRDLADTVLQTAGLCEVK